MKFNVTSTACLTVIVEAKDEEEAISISQSRMEKLCTKAGKIGVTLEVDRDIEVEEVEC